MVVKYELEKLGINEITVGSGWAEISEPMSPLQIENFKLALLKADLELIEDPKSILINKIITVTTEMINCQDGMIRVNFSRYLSQQLNLDYTYMANVFSATEGISIEQFIIHQRIKKVKQLIALNELTLAQISLKLNYSSSAHLSTQFKKVTGITPSQFKQSCSKAF